MQIVLSWDNLKNILKILFQSKEKVNLKLYKNAVNAVLIMWVIIFFIN